MRGAPAKSRREALAEAEEIRDGLGRGLDQEMIHPIAAMISLGIKTTGSCSGHPDRGHSFPWIDMEIAPHERISLLRELPSFHLAKQGSDQYPDNFRLQPSEVPEINSPDPGGTWARHLDELQRFAESALS